MTARHVLQLMVWLGLVSVFLGDVLLLLRIAGQLSRPAARQLWPAAPCCFALLTPLWLPGGLWWLGLVGLSALVHGAAHLGWQRRLAGQLKPAPAALDARIAALCRRWRITGPDRVSVDTAGACGPSVVGLWQQTLVLPVDALALPEQELDAIAAHELAHVQGRDPLKLWLAGIAGTLLGWHPLARRALAHLALEIELEADRRAALWLGDPRAYALTLGRWGLRFADVAYGSATALAGQPADLLLRLQVLLEPADPAPHLRPPARVRTPSAGRRKRLEWVMPAVVPLLCTGYLTVFLLVIRAL